MPNYPDPATDADWNAKREASNLPYVHVYENDDDPTGRPATDDERATLAETARKMGLGDAREVSTDEYARKADTQRTIMWVVHREDQYERCASVDSVWSTRAAAEARVVEQNASDYASYHSSPAILDSAERIYDE